jgi:hypothetical protein
VGTVKSIGFIILTSIGGGSKLLTRTWWAIRKGRNEVKKSARAFYNTLKESGIPDEDAKEIAVAYARPAYEILTVRNLIKIATEMSDPDYSIDSYT